MKKKDVQRQLAYSLKQHKKKQKIETRLSILLLAIDISYRGVSMKRDNKSLCIMHVNC